jgi:glycosyltransferase involved in cell wall biosynthesis
MDPSYRVEYILCRNVHAMFGGYKMGDMPLISVIVIFYNAEQFIEEAIESVFAQTNVNWELLLVDDGTIDKSTAIAQRYAEKYPQKVRYLEHPDHHNRGMSASRNLGIANARGEFIAFLDADDVWLPHKLELQAAALNSQPKAAMVYGRTQWWYSWTGNPEDRRCDFIHELGVHPNSLLQPPRLLACFLRMEGISPCICSVLIRRAALEQIGGFEETFQGLYEDQVLIAKVCLLAPVFVMSECLARYRQHPESNTSITRESKGYAGARQMFLEWLAVYLSEKNIKGGEVWNALQIEMLPFRYPHLFRLLQCARRSFLDRLVRLVHRLKLRLWGLPLFRQLRCLQFRRLRPVGNGKQNGTPIVRYYWNKFLTQHQADIQGTVLEIGSTDTIWRYGGRAVIHADAIDLVPHSPEVTIVADLSRADHVPSDRYDCFVNQFTTHLIYDIEAALFHTIRILKPGGVLLINFPCVDYYFPRGLDMGTGASLFMYWWFTPIQVENLFRHLGLQGVDYALDVYGNLFARIAYQLNLPAEELSRRELEHSDLGHPLLVCARVIKPASWRGVKPPYRDPWRPEVIPAQWNPTTGHYAT